MELRLYIVQLVLPFVLVVIVGCGSVESYADDDFGEGNVLTDSNSVRRAQVLLKSLGIDPGPDDGILDDKTIRAVQFFQLQAGLRPDGKITAVLLSSLENDGRLRSGSTNEESGPVDVELIAKPEIACAEVISIPQLADCLWSTTLYKNERGQGRRFGDAMAKAVGTGFPSCSRILDDSAKFHWFGAWPKSEVRLDYYYPGRIGVEIENCDHVAELISVMTGVSVPWSGCPTTEAYNYGLLEKCFDYLLRPSAEGEMHRARQLNLARLPFDFYRRYFEPFGFGAAYRSQLVRDIRKESERCADRDMEPLATAVVFGNLVAGRQRSYEGWHALQSEMRARLTCDDLIRYSKARGYFDYEEPKIVRNGVSCTGNDGSGVMPTLAGVSDRLETAYQKTIPKQRQVYSADLRPIVEEGWFSYDHDGESCDGEIVVGTHLRPRSHPGAVRGYVGESQITMLVYMRPGQGTVNADWAREFSGQISEHLQSDRIYLIFRFLPFDFKETVFATAVSCGWQNKKLSSVQQLLEMASLNISSLSIEDMADKFDMSNEDLAACMTDDRMRAIVERALDVVPYCYYLKCEKRRQSSQDITNMILPIVGFGARGSERVSEDAWAHYFILESLVAGSDMKTIDDTHRMIDYSVSEVRREITCDDWVSRPSLC